MAHAQPPRPTSNSHEVTSWALTSSLKPAQIHYVISGVQLYSSCLIDQRHSRAVHCVGRGTCVTSGDHSSSTSTWSEDDSEYSSTNESKSQAGSLGTRCRSVGSEGSGQFDEHERLCGSLHYGFCSPATPEALAGLESSSTHHRRPHCSGLASGFGSKKRQFATSLGQSTAPSSGSGQLASKDESIECSGDTCVKSTSPGWKGISNRIDDLLSLAKSPVLSLASKQATVKPTSSLIHAAAGPATFSTASSSPSREALSSPSATSNDYYNMPSGMVSTRPRIVTPAAHHQPRNSSLMSSQNGRHHKINSLAWAAGSTSRSRRGMFIASKDLGLALGTQPEVSTSAARDFPFAAASRNTHLAGEEVSFGKGAIAAYTNRHTGTVKAGLPVRGRECVLPVQHLKTAQRLEREASSREPTQHDLLTSATPTQPLAAITIPQFHFPNGRPAADDEQEASLREATEMFADASEEGHLYKNQMHDLAKKIGLPKYWGILLYGAAGGDKYGYITLQGFTAMWKRISSSCHDDASKFVRLLARQGCNYLSADDFVLIIQDVVDAHPGLQFLQDAPEFHSRYIHTVISRIFYTVNRSWSGKITIPELRKSNFLQTLSILDEVEDINQVNDYFSYEHFYVIYCKFWELDKDHDLFISKEDLARHNDGALSSRMIERMFSGAVTRGVHVPENKMSYTEFVWFLLSEEDKKQARSIEYWFRCMDLDGDGVISMYEMDWFYEDQVEKMNDMGIEPLPFNDLLCQMFDLVKPAYLGLVTLTDLKTCRLAYIFFDTFFNLEKYLDHEQKDPFSNSRQDGESDVQEPTDWEKYASEEYELLVAEEGANDDGSYDYDDDFEADEVEEVPYIQEPRSEFRASRPKSAKSPSGDGPALCSPDDEDIGLVGRPSSPTGGGAGGGDAGDNDDIEF